MSVKLRQEFPGLCAFDFQQITELMIEHILGWDRVNQISYANGGAFGVLDAWNTAIEEQGRKTLHSHWILYVNEWSELLRGLYSNDPRNRSRAATELETYVDNIISTKLFGLDTTGNLARQAYKHKCNVKQPAMPIVCGPQDLRHLRYKHGESSLKGDNFVICDHCQNVFSSPALVHNMMTKWLGESSLLKQKLRLAVKRFSGQDILEEYSAQQRMIAEFMTHALTNLHASTHTATCFKKGYECRNKLPQRACNCTKVHFDNTKPILWLTWMGNQENREPFIIEPKRHALDVYMNQYHPQLSSILGCNTNVQCGIDGGHIMYVTYYASKLTQIEDKYAYCRVAKTLYKRIRHQDEDAANGVESDNPFKEGYRCLLSAILSHTESTVTSGPMAWFIMRNESWFLFSHEHRYIGFDGVLGRSSFSPIVNIRSDALLMVRMHDYIYRPTELEMVNWYQFVADYDVVHISRKNENEIMNFNSKEHPLHQYRGIMKRKKVATPLISYLDFPNACEFDGNILDPFVTPNEPMEKFARAALCLFLPFRDKTLFDLASHQHCYTNMLQEAVTTNLLSSETIVRLQNIQNCHNMMKAGRQQDVLERITMPLPDPQKHITLDNDTETDNDLEHHIELFLTELVADLDEDDTLRSPEAPIMLNEIRKQGKDNCGYDAITANTVDTESCVYEIRGANANQFYNISRDDGDVDSGDDNSDMLPLNPRNITTDQMMTKARLTALSINVVRRHIEHIDEVTDINPNGSAGSIQEWAKVMFTDPDTNECDKCQQRAFEVIVSMLVLTFHHEAQINEGRHDVGTQAPSNRATYLKLKTELKWLTGMRQHEQLILFLTGPGGSGKTKVINAVMAYAKGFCKQLNYMFDRRMIVLTALSGVAATLINGETLHSAAKLNCKTITVEHVKEWKHSRLLIIDEISFANSADLTNLNAKLQLLKETVGQKFGNLHIVFTGDFSQLEPVTGRPLYHETNFAPWHDWVNCYIELTGQHRFKNDPEFGAIMNRIREGCPSDADIALLNTRVVNGDSPNSPTLDDLPGEMSYAVFRNVDRCAINNAIFAEHIRKTHSTNPEMPPPLHTLVIRSDDLTWKFNHKPFGLTAKHSIWSDCFDCYIKTAGERGKFVDAFLKLSSKIPLMYTENKDVPNGIANGTLCHLIKVILHNDVTESDFKPMNIDGYYVRTIDATKVDYILCKMEKLNRLFEVKADYVSCKIDMPIELIPGEKTRKIVRATINRFPALINHATTGHKLQGQGKDSLCISDWHYGANWPYVVLSRVTTLKGLYLLRPLRINHDFAHDDRLIQMRTRMRQKIPDPFDPD